MADFYDSIELDGVRKPIKDAEAARASDLEDVETALDGKFDKSGGTISGDVTIDSARLTVKNGAHSVQTLPNAAGIGNNHVVSDTDLFVQVGINTPEPLTVKASGVNLSDGTDPIPIIGVDYPVDEYDAANKGYVDGQTAAAKTYTDGQIALVSAAKVDKTDIDSDYTQINIGSEHVSGLLNVKMQYCRVGNYVSLLVGGYVYSGTEASIAPSGLTDLPAPIPYPGVSSLYSIGQVAFCTVDLTPTATAAATWGTNGIRMPITGQSGTYFSLTIMYRTAVNENDD